MVTNLGEESHKVSSMISAKVGQGYKASRLAKDRLLTERHELGC